MVARAATLHHEDNDSTGSLSASAIVPSRRRQIHLRQRSVRLARWSSCILHTKRGSEPLGCGSHGCPITPCPERRQLTRHGMTESITGHKTAVRSTKYSRFRNTDVPQYLGLGRPHVLRTAALVLLGA